ncbi:hypothetical protein ACFFKU_04625 [Kineococcus gynurae]|uniref:HTH cro/C1-type domain-containing protein n=1 Tax=Kineococcus gynurae TaxID=452979 RepID=A0ABV5LRC5_9ACTN
MTPARHDPLPGDSTAALARDLRARREAARLDRSGLAARLRVSHWAVTAVEDGTLLPSQSVLESWVLATGGSVEDVARWRERRSALLRGDRSRAGLPSRTPPGTPPRTPSRTPPRTPPGSRRRSRGAPSLRSRRAAVTALCALLLLTLALLVPSLLTPSGTPVPPAPGPASGPSTGTAPSTAVADAPG